MKVNISRDELVTALGHVLKVIAARPSIPILSGILIKTTPEGLSLYGSDLETSIHIKSPALVEVEGSTVVPGKIFFDILRALPSSSVLLETEGEMLSIRSQQAHFTVRTLPVDDFSAFPEIEGTNSLNLSVESIKDMVEKTSKSVSRDETRAILTAILVSVKENIIKMVATDSYRLSICERILDTSFDEEFEVLIPGKSFDDVVKMAQPKDTIELIFTTNQIKFSFRNIVFITRRIEGNYPNYQQLVPDSHQTSVTLVKDEFIESAKRASLMAAATSALTLTISPEDQTMTIIAASQDYGKAEEHIMAKVEGIENKISVNATYLLDGLSTIKSEFVVLEIIGPLKSGIIRSVDENFTYLFMPMRSS